MLDRQWPPSIVSIGASRFGCHGIGTGAGAGRTMGSLHQLPDNTLGALFAFDNVSAGEAFYHAAYAISAGINDRVTPLNALGEPDNRLWVPVTLDGSPLIRVPAADGYGKRYALVLSDPMIFPDPAAARVEGGGRCLFVRTCPLNEYGCYGYFDWPKGRSPDQFGQTFGGGAGGWFGSPNVAAAGSFSTEIVGLYRVPLSTPHAILPIVAGDSVTLMSAGDSILSGIIAGSLQADSTANSVGLDFVKMLDRPCRPAFHLNEALPGMTSFDSIANARTALCCGPTLILLETFSLNDNGCERPSVYIRAWERAMEFAFEASRGGEGSKVIILGYPPATGIGSFAGAHLEAARIAANHLARGSGYPYVDADTLLGVGSDPVSYAPGMSEDMVHLNKASSERLAKAVAAVAREAYGIR